MRNLLACTKLLKPPAALIVQHLYRNNYLTTITFIEEVLPFTDIIPTATVGESSENSTYHMISLPMCCPAW